MNDLWSLRVGQIAAETVEGLRDSDIAFDEHGMRLLAEKTVDVILRESREELIVGLHDLLREGFERQREADRLAMAKPHALN